MYQLFTKHRSRLSSKVSLVTQYTRNLIISVRWQLSSGDFPGRRIGKMRPLPPHSFPFHIVAENSVDISPIGPPSSIFPLRAVNFVVTLFFHYFSAFSPANVSVSSSTLRLSSLVSAGGALIHSSQLRPRRLFLFPLVPLLRRPLCPFTSRRTRLPHLSSPPRLPVSFPGTGNTTSRAKIHRDFNTFNSFIIRFASTPRAGNAGDTFHSRVLFLSLRQAAVRSSFNGLQLHLATTTAKNGCIGGARAR